MTTWKLKKHTTTPFVCFETVNSFSKAVMKESSYVVSHLLFFNDDKVTILCRFTDKLVYSSLFWSDRKEKKIGCDHYPKFSVCPRFVIVEARDHHVKLWMTAFRSIHICLLASWGNNWHLIRCGHEKPYRRNTGVQSFLACSQSGRQGGIPLGELGWHRGTCTEHRKIFRYREQLFWTNGQNWWISNVASCWESCLNMLGMYVKL